MTWHFNLGCWWVRVGRRLGIGSTIAGAVLAAALDNSERARA
jgi:hypothetical protein